MADAPSRALDALVHSLTIVFLLSLATERLTQTLKRRDWLPTRGVARALRRLRKKRSPNGRLTATDVNLKARLVTNAEGDVELDRARIDAELRAVNAENTLFVGVVLAILAGANALEGLPGVATPESVGAAAAALGLPSRIAGFVEVSFHLGQLALTGATAAVGSSFWYDLLRLVIASRRAREPVDEAGQKGTAPTSRPQPQALTIHASAQALLEDPSRWPKGITEMWIEPVAQDEPDQPKLIFRARGGDGALTDDTHDEFRVGAAHRFRPDPPVQPWPK